MLSGRTFRAFELAVLVFLMFSAGCGAVNDAEIESAEIRPNILLILADDMGYTDLGSFGGEIATPNLDTLAYGGLRFTNFHVGPSCAPTRGMLMSGTTTIEAGVLGLDVPLLPEVASLPERMRALGYHTYMAGKWNLGVEEADSPARRGFESSYALVRAGDNHLGHSNFPASDVAYRENGVRTDPPEGWYSSRLYTDKLIEYIDRNAGDGTPWFGYLALTAPHWPLQAPEDWIDRYRGRYDDGYEVLRETRVATATERGVLPDGHDLGNHVAEAPPWDTLDDEEQRRSARAMEIYAAMTENMDFHVGRLIDYLEETDAMENTVIFFLSDNGASGQDSSFRPRTIPRTDTDNSLANMGREGSFVAYGRGWAEAAMAPYRDVKGSLHSGGTLSSTFVHHGSVADPGGFDDGFLTVMDLLPTFVDIGGGEVSGTQFEGREVLPVRGRSCRGRVLGDAAPVHDEAVPFLIGGGSSLVRWPWKILGTPVGGGGGGGPVEWMLFNLADDPGETTDLAGQYPDVRAELVELMPSVENAPGEGQ